MIIKHLISSNGRIVLSSRCFASSASWILKTGDILRETRLFTNEDVIEYSKVSHDTNPLHIDREAAQNAGFGERLVHGMLVAGLFPRIISSHLPGTIYVSQSLHFRLPVYIGDEIRGEVEALNVKQNKKRYIAKFSTKCFKEGEVLVLDGEAMAILPTLEVNQLHPTSYE